MGITRSEVMATFERELPGTKIEDIDIGAYIATALDAPFIQTQVRMGIYTEDNLHEEFLSVARSFPLINAVEICSALIIRHMADVRTGLARAFVRQVALHERHHIVRQHYSGSIQMSAQNEQECWDWLEQHYPMVLRMSAIAEQESSTMNAVLQRIARITALQQAQ